MRRAGGCVPLGRMRRGTALVTLAIAVVAARGAAQSLPELARDGEWHRVLAVAVLRSEQLPLRPEEALVAAVAARRVGDAVAERRFLEQAGRGGATAAVAAVELAGMIAEEQPAAAAQLALPAAREPSTAALGEAAAEALVRAIGAGLPEPVRAEVGRGLEHVRRGRARPVAAALGVAEGDVDRLAEVVLGGTRDLAALTAAGALDGRAGLSPKLRWRIAETYYRHALYELAAPRLEALEGVDDRSVPADRVAFLRGRCAFRVGEWRVAETWYRRALERTAHAEPRADLLVHLARTLELAGDLDGAVEAARRAVLARASDDRRLFLARLRLRREEVDLALLGISRARSRAARDRGELMVALDELRRGLEPAAADRLGRVDRAPWSGPAALLRARASLAGGRPEEALAGLSSRVRALDGYWAQRARALVRELPEEVVRRWREDLLGRVVGGDDRRRRRAVAEWSVLEPEAARLPAVRAWTATLTELPGPASGSLEGSIAGRLWDLGLPALAVRWDSRSLPDDTPATTLWSALRMVEHGAPWEAIRLADRAWRLAGDDIDPRGYPPPLRAAMLPLPFADEVRRAAADAGAPWQLVAAVAREESRFDPRALSAVGARGLMQLMPATAAAVALRTGADPARLDVFEPATALRLGASELARLLAAFDGRAAPAVAAYNAGEPQARLWLEQCGPGCTEERYVAQITFTATRIYTADVLWSARTYLELGTEGDSGDDAANRAPSRDAAAAALASPSPSS